MSNTTIHPTSIIMEGATLGNNITIGPFCTIGSKVVLHDNIKIKSHVVIEGDTTIGEYTEIFPFASIGCSPQDLKYEGEDSKLVIGKNVILRENVTVNIGTKNGGMITSIGDNCLIMACSHIAHDCIIGNNCILSNSVGVAGHVELGEHTIIGGLSGIQQFVKIGNNVMVGGMTGVREDVVPYAQVQGRPAILKGVNLIGLKRLDFPKKEIDAIRHTYKQLFKSEHKSTVFLERIEDIIEDYKDSEAVRNIVDFLKKSRIKPLCKPTSIQKT